MNTEVALAIGTLALGCLAVSEATDGFSAITAEGARRITIAENPKPVPNFALETMDGSWKQLPSDSPALVEFIYTTCPTVCQASGGDFAELRDHLASTGLSVPMYSISFDPEVDDVDAMQGYAELHTATGSPWTVARPNQAELEKLLEVFQVTVIPDEWGGYQHNIAVLLINRTGKFAGAFDTRSFDEIQDAIRAEL